ncbi:MAG: hypothetical protein LUD47_01520 [Clostridia bacterium]|nr:hypothetical protein [Clostridia bacterium]
MYVLPTFYVGDDEKRLEREIRMIKKERDKCRVEIKHFYYGFPIKRGECIEDCDIKTSCLFERAYSGALPHVEAKLREVRGGELSETEKKAETKRKKTYEGLTYLRYDEEEKNGGTFSYHVYLKKDNVLIYKIVEKTCPKEGTEGYLCRNDKTRTEGVTNVYRETLFYYLTQEYRDGRFLKGHDIEMYRNEVRNLMNLLVPCKIYSPRKCDIEAEEKLGRRGLTNREIFIDALRKIGIDEWRGSYYGRDEMWENPDGTLCENHTPVRWRLFLKYPRFATRLACEGGGDCPFNLHLLTRLLDGLDDSEFFDYNRDYFLLDDGK